MKKDYKNIEDLFKDSFNDYRLEPTKGLWEKINLKLNLRQFLSPGFKSFNVYYLSILAGLITALTIYLSDDTTYRLDKPKDIDNKIETRKQIKSDSQKIRTEFRIKPTEEISKKTVVFTRKELKLAQANRNEEAISPLVLRNLKTFSQIYGDTLNKIETITVSPPRPLFTLASNEGCAPFEIKLKNHTKLAQYYKWNFGDGEKSVKESPAHTYLYPGVYTIKLIAIGLGGMAYSIIDSVVVHEIPNNKVHWPYQTNISAGQKIVIPVESENTIKYEWNFGDGVFSNEKKPQHIYQKEGEYTILLKTWTDKKCVDSVKVKDVKVFKNNNKIIFPNAFTPNPEGSSSGKYQNREIHNDIFHPIVRGQITEYELNIYSRAGIMVFQSKDVKIGWDGYYQSRMMPEGVYPYVATGTFEGGKRFLQKGNVTIIHR